MLYSDFNTWLVDDLLIKADKMTMANSVELRVPFLDYRVVEQAATIPSSMKTSQAANVKWILKKAMKGRLPESILPQKKDWVSYASRGDVSAGSLRLFERSLVVQPMLESRLFQA